MPSFVVYFILQYSIGGSATAVAKHGSTMKDTLHSIKDKAFTDRKWPTNICKNRTVKDSEEMNGKTYGSSGISSTSIGIFLGSK